MGGADHTSGGASYTLALTLASHSVNDAVGGRGPDLLPSMQAVQSITHLAAWMSTRELADRCIVEPTHNHFSPAVVVCRCR